MRWLLYNLLFFPAFLLLLPHFLLRMKRRGGYAADFWQRVGRYDEGVLARLGAPGRTWVHAVSVGECYVAFRLIEELRDMDPSARFILTVTTSTAHALARRELNENDVLLYFPVDAPWVIRRVLARLQPARIFILECELWPNLIRLAASRNIPVAIVNGRLSANSHRGYRRLLWFTRDLLPRVSLFCMQSAEDAARMVDIGAPSERARVLGSTKYDVVQADPGDTKMVRRVLDAAGIDDGRVVLLGGSTWDGEEAALVRIFRAIRESHPELALILVPRHAERREQVAQAVRAEGFRVVLRSTLDLDHPAPADPEPSVFVVDTTGELRTLYAAADIIFVGKSLTQHGGQNLLEPAVFGKPVLVGPNLENFPVISRDFLEAGALLQVPDEAELESAIRRLVETPSERTAMGERAAKLVVAKRGVMKETAALLAELA